MARHIKTFCIFNPYTLQKSEKTYDEVMEMTGRSRSSIGSMINRRKMISTLRSYMLPIDVTVKELRDLAEKAIIEDEMWRPIPEWDGYLVSNYGRVKTIRKGSPKFMIPFINRAGYMSVRFKKDGTYHTLPIHRLVATAFISKTDTSRFFYYKKKTYNAKIEDINCVVHINNDIFDNRADNLIWVSSSDISNIRKKKSIPVIKIDPITKEELDYYDSLLDAGSDNYITPEAIGNCIRGKTATSGGFEWRVDIH